MIKLFRKLRQQSITGKSLNRYLLYAIGEIVLVVIGILIALQINNWNEEQNNRKEELFILSKLQSDIHMDIATIQRELEDIDVGIRNFNHSLEILKGKKEATLEEFKYHIGLIRSVVAFEQNTTTFDYLISSGKIELISNPALLDTVVSYYNLNYKGWDTAMRDYTRNIIAPYLMNFDHIIQMDQAGGASLSQSMTFSQIDVSEFKVPGKTIEDYQNDLFIINAVRQKLYNIEGQRGNYLDLLALMKSIDQLIEKEIKRN